MSSDLVKQEGSDEFDDIFFGSHGVGDTPIDKKYDVIAHSINPNVATGDEYAFVRNIVKGESQIESYIKVFGTIGRKGQELSRKALTHNASRLLDRPRVQKALFEIQEKHQVFMQEDMTNLVAELNEDRELARALGQPSAAIAAVKAKASLLGLEQQQPVGDTININMNDDQKALIFERVKKKLIAKDIIDADYVDVTPDDE